MKSSTKYIVLMLSLVMVTCVEPYDFDALKYEKVLVIDGAISDLDEEYEVEITYTYPLGSELEPQHVTDAEVWVENSSGNRFDYTLATDQKYISPAGMTGVVGESYQLYVKMPDGTLYQSEPQLLKAAPAIDTIYGQYAELPSEDGTVNVGGIQFFIDSESITGNTHHFRYEWEEAFKIITPYPARYELTEDSSIVRMDTSLGICYKEGFSNSLIYGTTEGVTSDKMLEFPIRFLSEEQQQLRVRYTILVRQYAISEAAYLFYKRLEENNQSGGSLFDQQTGSVFGNMYSSTDGDQAVLGFFEVSGVSERRQFFNYSDFDERFSRPVFPFDCYFGSAIKTIPDSAAYYLTATGGNIYDYTSFEPPAVSIHTRSCTDCSYYADLIAPSYWIE